MPNLKTLDEIEEGDPITNPVTQIIDESRAIVRRDNRMGTLIGVQMAYSGGLTGITSPVVKVFGRYTDVVSGDEGGWQILKNRLGDIAVPLVPASTDVAKYNGGLFYTTADPEAHFFDTQGCNEFLVGVEVVLAAETGSIDVAALQVKII